MEQKQRENTLSLVRTVDFHHRSGPVTPLLRKPAGLRSWTESKLFTSNPGLIFPHSRASPHFPPHPTEKLWACAFQSVVCRLPVKKINWQCLFKMQIALLDLRATESDFWV